MKVLNTSEKYQARVKQWCKATGLKTTKVGGNKVLPWFDAHSYPIEFDHQRIFYYSPEKLYILMAEPYPAAAGSAAAKAMQLAKGRNFDMKDCDLDVGLWFPGTCRCTLISRAGTSSFLDYFASFLPSKE